MASRYRNTASFGKRQEFVVIAELLKRGYDVYLTLVDDQQIECIIRLQQGAEIRYFDVQIKARSRECDPRNGAEFAQLRVDPGNSNFFFIFYSEPMESYWIMSAADLVTHGYQSKEGASKGTFRAKLARWLKGENRYEEAPQFRTFRGDFDVFRRQP